MKIAIQGHPTRGKEVIKILESLGGKNTEGLEGTHESFYYIDNENEIGDDYKKNFPLTYKLYTLEEFKEQFPFKIGDIILLKGVNKPYEIIALELYMNKLCYKLDNGFHYNSKALTTYKEMKEERNITLTLDKAKEWYKKGGELREIALQAFTEKELTKVDLPKSWKEFCTNFPIKKGECYTDSCSDIAMASECIEGRDIMNDRNLCPSQKSAEAHLAMMQLEQLRDCWRQGNIPQGIKYKIRKVRNIYTVVYGEENSFLSFCDQQTAKEFLECFRDLIEKAGDLI